MLKLISAFIQSRQLDCEWKLGEALMLSLLISMAGCLVGFMLLVALYFQPLTKPTSASRRQSRLLRQLPEERTRRRN